MDKMRIKGISRKFSGPDGSFFLRFQQHKAAIIVKEGQGEKIGRVQAPFIAASKYGYVSFLPACTWQKSKKYGGTRRGGGGGGGGGG